MRQRQLFGTNNTVAIRLESNICINMCVYVCMYVCMYIRMYAYISNDYLIERLPDLFHILSALPTVSITYKLLHKNIQKNNNMLSGYRCA